MQLEAQKRYRHMDTIREELKTALTKRARKLKSETEFVSGGADDGIVVGSSEPELKEARFADIRRWTVPGSVWDTEPCADSMDRQLR